MPVHADLPSQALRLWHERRTVKEMATLLGRPEHEVSEALVMLGVVKTGGSFVTKRVPVDEQGE
jgi:hypothetical protein